jgi:hypothetical protein
MMPWGTTIKGLAYTIGAWLINALVVLPATGEGLAGSANLSLAGVLWYAAAHTLFFMLLAYGFALHAGLHVTREAGVWPHTGGV